MQVGEEEGDEAEMVPVFRLSFRYDPQPNDPDLLPVWRRMHWGRWVRKEEKRGFAAQVIQL